MLQLLSPAGLWALAALSLPLAIHLWRPPPRTVRLGSLRFLENLPRHLHDLRWRERWLLAARLALLALLALLLAGPRWQRPPPHGPQRWALLDPAAVPNGGSLARLRALQSAGYETHTMAADFPGAADLPAMHESTVVPDLWSLLREADAELPADSLLAVFSPGRMTALHGARPAMTHCRVEWVQTPDATPTTALAPPGPVATSPPLAALILHDANRAADARRLAAALRAAAQVSGHALDIQIRATNPEQGNTTSTPWVFWLSAQTVPSAWTAHGANVVSETPANSGDHAAADPPASWIVPAPETPGARAFVDPVRLWRRASSPLPPPGAVDWTDGFGQPLLTVAREGRGRHWRFFGRFDPAWTDLPRGSTFPAWLRALLWPQDGSLPADPAHDRRLVDPSQCHPSEMPVGRASLTLQRAGDTSVDLHGPLWTLAAALFGLERVLSSRRSAAAVTPPPISTPVAASR